MNQKPQIKIGTELSIGTVVGIRKNSVSIKKGGSIFQATFTEVEKVFEDDQNAQTTR